MTEQELPATLVPACKLQVRAGAIVIHCALRRDAPVNASVYCTQVGPKVDLIADNPMLITAYLWEGGSAGHMSVGVRIPPLISGAPAWNSIPQKQQIGWSADYHGAKYRLAVEWTRANQTAVQVTVTGSAAALANPRNGLQIRVGSGRSAFSLSANATWVNALASYTLREGSGTVSSNARNTDIQISGPAESVSGTGAYGDAASAEITFLFVADTDVNADLMGPDTGLSATLVR